MEMNITALYFSPTKGTKKAVECLLTCFDNVEKKTLVDNTLPKQREIIHEFKNEDLVVVANPVYAGQLPPAMGLWKNLRGNDTPCIIMACYGNRHYDDTLAQMQQMLEVRGFSVIGAIAPVIPHIFASNLGAGRPNMADKAVFKVFADAICKKIATGDFKEISVPGDSNPQPKQALPIPKTYDKKLCTLCGACAAHCPVGAIDPLTAAIDDKLCINCMRCVKICPVHARTCDCEKIKTWLESMCKEERPVEYFL